jgi:hypothetical protein
MKNISAPLINKKCVKYIRTNIKKFEEAMKKALLITGLLMISE